MEPQVQGWQVVTALVGVYHADGGIGGELRYAWSRLVRGEHCSLCDTTHSGLVRRKAWDAMVGRLPVPVRLVHLDEQPDEVRRVSAGRTPCVVALRAEADGGPVVVLDRAAIDPLGGDVAAFERALHDAVGSLT
jgi:hypothetical protein